MKNKIEVKFNTLFFNKKWVKIFTLLFISILITSVFYKNTLMQMVRMWSNSDTYTHGFIVPFISIWLIWRIRHKWINIEPEPSTSALALIFLFSIVWFAGNLVAVNSVTQFSFVMMISLCIPTILGWRIAYKILFPIAFLFFAVPIGDFLLPIMMNWTADFTVIALQFTGIPVYREELQFVIPSGRWSVVEACSGIRYLLASMTVGSLFAYLNYRSFFKRSIFILFAIAVPLVANWLRAYMIVLIGHYSDNKLATGIDHLIYGWLFFGFIIIVMLFAGMKWSDLEEKEDFVDFNKSKFNNFYFDKKYGFIIILMLLILPAPIYLNKFINNNINDASVTISEIILNKSWKLKNQTNNTWAPHFPSSTFQYNKYYVNDSDEKVGLSVSYYRKQNYGSKLITSTNSLISSTEEKWEKLSSEKKNIILEKENFNIESSILREKKSYLSHKESKILVWKFYWVNEKFTANNFSAKVMEAIGKIKGDGDDGAIVVIYSPFDSDIFSTNELLKNFLEDNISHINNALLETKNKNH